MKFSERVYAPGPTPVPEDARLSLAETNPYHRTDQFATVIRDCVSTLGRLLGVDWSIVPLAASGTGGMQMAVDNTAGPDDTALVVESGKFGQRWTRMLQDRGVRVVSHTVPTGQAVRKEALAETLDENPDVKLVYTTLVETSTLVRHPIDEIGGLLDDDQLLVVDAISGFAADPFRPGEWNVDLAVLGSQKGLMAPPGLSLVAASPRVVDRSRSLERRGTYFDLPTAVDKLDREDQTPWTPSMNLLRSLRSSLRTLEEEGLDACLDRHGTLAAVCRRAVRTLGLKLLAEEPSNAGTAVCVPEDVDANTLRSRIHEEYRVYLPGGRRDLDGRIIRIGHLGDVDFFDILTAVSALELGLCREGYLDRYELGTGVQAAERAFEERVDE